MVLLLLSASWTLALTLLAGLCHAARNGDLQHDRPNSRSVLSDPPDRENLITITRAKHGQRTAPNFAQGDLTETAA
jgi:hypothetical protein